MKLRAMDRARAFEIDRVGWRVRRKPPRLAESRKSSSARSASDAPRYFAAFEATAVASFAFASLRTNA